MLEFFVNRDAFITAVNNPNLDLKHEVIAAYDKDKRLLYDLTKLYSILDRIQPKRSRENGLVQKVLYAINEGVLHEAIQETGKTVSVPKEKCMISFLSAFCGLADQYEWHDPENDLGRFFDYKKRKEFLDKD